MEIPLFVGRRDPKELPAHVAVLRAHEGRTRSGPPRPAARRRSLAFLRLWKACGRPARSPRSCRPRARRLSCSRRPIPWIGSRSSWFPGDTVECKDSGLLRGGHLEEPPVAIAGQLEANVGERLQIGADDAPRDRAGLFDGDRNVEDRARVLWDLELGAGAGGAVFRCRDHPVWPRISVVTCQLLGSTTSR